MKVAKLVAFSLMTRVIVDENATDDQIIAAAYKGVQDKIDNRELGDNLESIEDDEEMPYDEDYDGDETPESTVDNYYQPELDDKGDILGHPGETIFSFEVWASKDELMKDFPKCTPITYSGDDIENPQFVDIIRRNSMK